jgi:predicted SnoaL-like aldol condensation-catalyzing enzyme
MSNDMNRKVVEDFYEQVFCKHDLDVVDRFMHDEYIQHNPDVAQGKAGFVKFHKGFFRAFPDSRASINMLVAEGDLVFVYNTITATHMNEGFLDYQPTGNKVKYDVVDMFRIRDGKLCEHWDVADTRALFTQVGTIREVKG